VRTDRGTRRMAALAAIVLALAGCAADGNGAVAPSASAPSASSPSRPLVLPPASSGEACELRRFNAGNAAAGETFLIRCGGADLPSASFGRELDPALSLDTIVQTNAWIVAARGEAACGPTRRIGLPQGTVLRHAVAVACTAPPLHTPLILGATIVGRLLVTFATLPQTAGVVEAAIATMIDEGVVPAVVVPPGTPTLADVARQAANAAGGDVTLTEVERLRTLSREIDVAAADGDPAGALALRRDLRTLLVRAFGAGATGQGPLLVDEAALLIGLDRPVEAARLLRAAAPVVARSPLWRDRVRLGLVEARAAVALGRPEGVSDPLALAEAALEGDASDAVGFQLAAVDILLAAGLPDAAEDRLARARMLVASGQVPRLREADLSLRAAGIAERRGDRAIASAHLDEALAQRRALYGDDAGVAEILVRRARLDLAAGDAEAARTRWRAAIDILMQESAPDAPLPSDLVAGYLDSVFAGSGLPDDAALAQVFKVLQTPDDRPGRVARLRMLRTVVASVPGAAERRFDLADSERALTDLRLRRARLRAGRTTPAQMSAADAAVAEATRAVQIRRERLAATAPALAALAPARRTTASQAAATLRPGEVLVLVAMGEVRTTVLTLSADGRLAGHRLSPGATELAAQVEAAARAVRAVTPRDAVRGAGRGAGSAAFDILGPAAPTIAASGAVVTVATGPLLDMPAQALWPDGPPATVVPTLAAFMVAQERPGRASEAAPPFLAALGGPFGGGPGVLDGGDCAATAPVLPLRLPTLRGAGALVDAMAATFGSDRRSAVRTGSDALSDVLAAGPRVAMIATHAALPAGGGCTGDPGLIAGDRTIVGVATIAATPTAAGTVLLAVPAGARGGQGIALVAEALLAAGARRVIVADPVPVPAVARAIADFAAGRTTLPPPTVRVFGALP
jgi:tetratricopeptide (TPR) repeat protein